MSACKGMNCNSTDGTNHSVECKAEHAAAVASGRFLSRDEFKALKRAMEIAVFHMHHDTTARGKADYSVVRDAMRLVTVTSTRAGGSEC